MEEKERCVHIPMLIPAGLGGVQKCSILKILDSETSKSPVLHTLKHTRAPTIHQNVNFFPKKVQTLIFLTFSHQLADFWAPTESLKIKMQNLDLQC